MFYINGQKVYHFGEKETLDLCNAICTYCKEEAHRGGGIEMFRNDLKRNELAVVNSLFTALSEGDCAGLYKAEGVNIYNQYFRELFIAHEEDVETIKACFANENKFAWWLTRYFFFTAWNMLTLELEEIEE